MSIVQLKYLSRDGTVVLFASEVLSHFEEHRQIGKIKTEVGGQLFARLIKNEVRISRVTGPNDTDKRGWCWFNPDRKKQNTEIKKLFSMGLHFVGDWHTHPQDHPAPSSLDLQSMEECFRKSRHQLSAFIMVIIGRAKFPDGFWVSLHTADGWELLKLSPNPSTPT